MKTIIAAGTMSFLVGQPEITSVPPVQIPVEYASLTGSVFMMATISEIAAVAGICNDEPSWDDFTAVMQEYRRELRDSIPLDE